MKKIRRLINLLVLFVAGLYLVFFVLLHLPVVKARLGSMASDFLSQKLGTEVHVGKVDIGLFNRVTVDDILIYDQKQKKMLSAGRASVNLDIIELIQQRGRHISISSAQLFGLDATIYKETADAKPNFQFVIDSLSSKDKKEHTPLNLDISSIIIRNGRVKYDQLDAPRTPDMFSVKHLAVTDITGNINLNKVTDDSLNVNIHNLSLKEKSGLDLQKLSLSLAANKSNARISDLALELPNTSLSIPTIAVGYKFQGKKFVKESLNYSVTINESRLTPSDLASLSQKTKAFSRSIALQGNFVGNLNEITVSKLMVSDANDLVLDCDAYTTFASPHHWSTDIRNLQTSSSYVSKILTALGISTTLPPVVDKLGNVSLVAKADGDDISTINIQGDIKTALGNANVKASRSGNKITAYVDTPGLKLGEIVENQGLGNISGIIDAEAVMSGNQLQALKATADVSDFDYNSYHYKSIKVDGQYTAGRDISGTLAVVSPDADLSAEGSYKLDGSHTIVDAQIKNFQPSALKIPQLNIDGVFAGDIKADISGITPQTIQGTVEATNLKLHTKKFSHTVNHLFAKRELSGDYQKVNVVSDFGYVDAEGQFDYSTLASSVTSCLSQHISTIPGIPVYKKTDNTIKLTAQISDDRLAKEIFNLPLEIKQPIYILADIDDHNSMLDVSLEVPEASFKGNEIMNGYIHLYTAADSLKGFVNADVPTATGVSTHCQAKVNAFDNHLATHVDFDNNGRQHIHGAVNADAVFSENSDGKPAAQVHILPSNVVLSDTIWNILSSDISYSSGKLDISNLSIGHNDQYITVNSSVSDNQSDVIVDLNDVDVASVLKLVKFHSVEFDGDAFGRAKISNIFDSPVLEADLKVKGFRFETGLFGDLSAKANWDIKNGDINIDGIVDDEDNRNTIIKGFISPHDKGLDLHIQANGTRLEFVKKYTSSFIGDMGLFGYGDVRVFGPFKGIDLEGKAVVDGSVFMKTLNTTYTMNRDSVIITPGDIFFSNDTIRDKYNNVGIAYGHLFHTHLGKVHYAFDINAQNLLGYDTHSFNGDTFYGTAFATGNCIIKGKSGEVIIDITGKPGPGTRIVYNVTSPDAISNTDFIHWTDRNKKEMSASSSATDQNQEVHADLKLNFDIDTNEDLTLELLMDPSNGDYIALNGQGNLLANYYNKGAFNLYGNYLVDKGVYRLTIQNVIRRMFEFQSGGSIGFNGDAYNAKLDLQALYPVNGVSLADINIGKSFSNNNIRVNCLMNITGTPNQPLVDFSFDMPTVSTDIKSMVNSLVNSEEEMNQQVLYLLAVGRFYNANNNYAESTARMSQTSLAMQSILSGTISQQLSNALGMVVDNNNWNIGANISTGDEGFNNAEYEGLISGRMMNSRLLFNGQFGYRDNPNATTSFIGDFDLRYLLLPNGNAALKVYNQTNDKYFTKNSLNTQGIGLILKKDFSTWRDLFNISNRK